MDLKKHTISAIFLFILVSGFPLSAQECPIAVNGEPRAVIVFKGKAQAGLAEAISELKNYIFQISGAEIEIKQEADSELNSLILSLEPESEPEPCDIPDTQKLRELNIEGFVIRVSEGQTWLAGRSELALQHGIYWLLEKWGCRWLFPGEAGEVIPKRPTLTVTKAMETDQQPRFLMRNLWYNWGGWLPEDVQEDFRLWNRHNRMEYSLTGYIGHAYNSIVSKRDEKLFEEHPEYYRLKNGKRVRGGQICTSNPEVRERAVAYAFRFFEKNPDATLVSFSPNDGGGTCQCSECRAIGNFSTQALTLANYVAVALKKNPQTRDKMVGMYAYFITSLPPSIAAEDNVMAFVATKFNFLPWRFLVNQWEKKTDIMGIRGYASILPWHWTKPVWRLESLRKKVQFWNESNIIAINIESGNDWGGWGLYHYVLARLLWNPDEHVDSIVDDYLQKGFGNSAGDMRNYFSRWKGCYSQRKLASASRDIAEALEKAPTEELRNRIGQYALYLHHLYLYNDYKRGGSDTKRLEAMKKLVGFDWRLVNTNMAHTLPLLDNYLIKAAKKRFTITAEEFNSWKRSEPFTYTEMMIFLAADLKRSPD